MKILLRGSKGQAVSDLQRFLRGEGSYQRAIDGQFGPQTEKAVKVWQADHGLDPDGVVGPSTWAAMIAAGMSIMPEVAGGASLYPKRVGNPLGSAGAAKLFGSYKWKHTPTRDNREAITILDSWEEDNIIMVTVPQLVAIGASKTGRARVHRKIAPQFLALWAAWEAAGLLPHIHTWEGAFTARLIRGSSTTLSNHAYGSAFDVNAQWNSLGHRGARPGDLGCVWPLVPLAVKHGFYWGGWFKRPDLMHFEANKIIP